MKPSDGLNFGQVVKVTLHNDDRVFRGVYLGPAGDAADRTDRRIFVIDAGNEWLHMMEPAVATAEKVPE